MLIAAGLLIAVLAVLLVLEPVLRAGAGVAVRPVAIFSDSDDEDDPVQRRRDRALAALKEIEFDHATAKLSDADYERLRTSYTAEALEALRATDGAAPAPAGTVAESVEDAVERLIASARAQAKGKKFCIECGSPLEGSGRFCVECGTKAAA
jgi:hypothetical protein